MNHPIHSGRAWRAADRTGGQIDAVFDQLREDFPGLIVERLEVTHPADDNNVYFVRQPHQDDWIQVDTYPDGQSPFLIEDGGRHDTAETPQAITIIRDCLEQDRRGAGGA